jgi:HAD superfamily hydrolase (TIGR01484 family)
MIPVSAISAGDLGHIRGIMCDIDDTLTWHGRLIPEAFTALHHLQLAGLRVVPVTGRPAGWVDQIARLWPVDAVVGENGGLWFHMSDHGLERHYIQPASERNQNRAKLDALAHRILAEVPGCALASDQPFRDLDLAIDYCEDVARLPPEAIDQIVEQFTSAGATSKVSSIHVNGWFGTFDKLQGCRELARTVFGVSEDELTTSWAYVGDSANDEPMFAAFTHTFGVANVADFLDRMAHHPRYVAASPGGHGFAEIAHSLLASR